MLLKPCPAKHKPTNYYYPPVDEVEPQCVCPILVNNLSGVLCVISVREMRAKV